MKNNERNDMRREEALFRAVGKIDDRFVSEAMEYRAPRKKAKVLPWVTSLSSVAAAILAFAITLPLLMNPKAPSEEDPPLSDISTAVLWSVAEAHTSNRALLLCLSELKAETKPLEEPPALTVGEAQIIWKDESDGTYYAVSLKGVSKQRRLELLELLEKAPAAKVDAESETPPYSLWIDLGDGTAYSPYLPATSGTAFYGAPADYAPEQLPAEALAAFLEALLRDCVS